MSEPSTHPEPRPDPPPSPRVLELRVTRIRFEASSELMTVEPTPDSLGAAVAREAAYAKSYAAALAGGGAFDPPWPPGNGFFNNFWSHYLQGDPDSVGARRAWRLFVPLRLAIPVGSPRPEGPQPRLRVVAKGFPAALQIEAFLFSHGVALATRAQLVGDWSLEEAVDAVRLRGEAAGLTLVRDGQEDPRRYKLELLERRLIDTLGQMIGWSRNHPRYRAPVFTIATPVSGSGVDPEREVTQGDPIHLALEGLCSGDEGWRNMPAPDLAQRVLGTKNETLGNLLYAREHERAVWHPGAFGQTGKHRSRLGCYHRNLMQLTVQIESLLGLMTLAADDLRTSKAIGSARLEELAKSGALLLGRLYGKAKDIYRSSSAPHQIGSSGRRKQVDAVRAHFRLPPLFSAT